MRGAAYQRVLQLCPGRQDSRAADEEISPAALRLDGIDDGPMNANPPFRLLCVEQQRRGKGADRAVAGTITWPDDGSPAPGHHAAAGPPGHEATPRHAAPA